MQRQIDDLQSANERQQSEHKSIVDDILHQNKLEKQQLLEQQDRAKKDLENTIQQLGHDFTKAMANAKQDSKNKELELKKVLENAEIQHAEDMESQERQLVDMQRDHHQQLEKEKEITKTLKKDLEAIKARLKEQKNTSETERAQLLKSYESKMEAVLKNFKLVEKSFEIERQNLSRSAKAT